MITKLNKNVLHVKDIPSNLIEEAILILKIDDKKIKNKTKEILMIEANELIEDYGAKLKAECEARQIAERNEENRKKRLRTNILSILGIILFTTLIVLIVT